MQVKKIAICVLLVLIQQHYSTAQDNTENNIIIGLTGGFGMYMQSDMKKLNTTVQNGLQFEAGMTDNFPPALYWGMHFLFRIKQDIYIGPDYKFHTTGSRLAYKDYSGSYLFDQIITNHSLAIQLEGSIHNKKNINICLGALCGINISTWKVQEDLVVAEVHNSSTTRLDALRPFVCPSIKLKCRITDLISIVPSVSYNFDLFGKYHLHGQREAKSDMIASWNGPRADISLDLSF
jgi:hypothetical protein